MNDSAAQVDKWVCAINAIIKQMQSEFSPIYEGPESLHCVQSGKDKSFNPITAGKKECVFGCNLSNLCNREKTTVPAFMEELIRVIERKGVDNDGLYRINGNLAEVQKLRCQIDQGKNNFNDSDIHVLAGTLKTFLRELEDPIIPKHLQEQFLDATSTQDKNRKFHKIKELVKQLPIAHYETLKVLCRHLNNVVDVSHLNRMHVQNIALVFGPTICRVNIVTSSNNIFNLNIMLPNDLVEFIFRNHEELFDSNTKVYNK